MLSRLFNRRRNTQIDPLEVRNGNSVAAQAISSNGQSEPRQQEGTHNLLRLISRPRPQDTANRVSNAVQLVEALRRVETMAGNHSTGRRGAGHGQPLQIFVALALRELDELIDRMTYEELLQAFGGKLIHLNNAIYKIYNNFRLLDTTDNFPPFFSTFADRQYGAGMDANDINSIPSLTCSHTEAKSMAASGDSCSVCLDSFCTNQTLRKLPGCYHAFHADCIDPWLRKKADCPVCRRPVKAANEGK